MFYRCHRTRIVGLDHPPRRLTATAPGSRGHSIEAGRLSISALLLTLSGPSFARPRDLSADLLASDPKAIVVGNVTGLTRNDTVLALDTA